MTHKIRSAIRWNAVAIILRANKESSELGGHIASFQSSALLYDIGFGHFWRGASDDHGGDLIYVQGQVLNGRLPDRRIAVAWDTISAEMKLAPDHAQ